MKTIYELKVFKNGGSSAVRIPAALRIDQSVLFLEVDETSGEMELFKDRPQKFKRLLELLETHGPISESDWGLERDASNWSERESLKQLERHFE